MSLRAHFQLLICVDRDNYCTNIRLIFSKQISTHSKMHCNTNISVDILVSELTTLGEQDYKYKSAQVE